MLRNRKWDRPRDWDNLTKDEKNKWNETADHIERFYRDMRTHRHINIGLSSYMTPGDETRARAIEKLYHLSR